jgi:hypothetical protein
MRRSLPSGIALIAIMLSAGAAHAQMLRSFKSIHRTAMPM